MEKINLCGNLKLMRSFLDEIDTDGKDVNYITKLFSKSHYVDINLIEESGCYHGVLVSEGYEFLVRGKKLDADSIALYLCGENGDIYFMPYSKKYTGINSVMYKCNFTENAEYNYTVAGYSDFEYTPVVIDADHFYEIKDAYNKLSKKASNDYNTFTEAGLADNMFLLEEFGMFEDDLMIGEIEQSDNFAVLPLYDISVEIEQKISDYADTLNLDAGDYYEIDATLVKPIITKVMDEKELNISHGLYDDLVNMYEDIFVNNDESYNTTTLLAKRLMEDKFLAEVSIEGPDKLLAYSLYEIIDDKAEVSDVLDVFKVAEEVEDKELFIVENLKNQFYDDQLNDILLIFENLQQLKKYLKDEKFDDTCELVEELCNYCYLSNKEEDFAEDSGWSS